MRTKQISIPQISDMTTVTISSRYQVTIPRDIRKAMGLRPGQRIQAFQYGNRIELIPVIPMRKARGMFKGIDTSVPRGRV
jgi:AbrB family looped-hinge helix DNA binding protein